MQTQISKTMKTMLYKACPRCGGDLVLDSTAEAPEYACLQCGRSQPATAVLQAMPLPRPPERLVA